MCYILYGAVNPDVNAVDLERITKQSRYTFRPGTKHDLKMSISGNTYEYRVTDWVCDCDFPVGAKDPQAEVLKELAAVLTELRSAENAVCVYFSKTWAGSRNKKEETVYLDGLDVPVFLANMEPSCLYRIDLTEKTAQ